MMQTRAVTVKMDATTPPKRRKFEGSSTLVKVGQVRSEKSLQIQSLDGLLDIVLKVPVAVTRELEDDGGTVLDKIGNIRFVPELGATLFGARWTCGEYTLEWFDDHVAASHDSSTLRGMLIRCACLLCLHSFVFAVC